MSASASSGARVARRRAVRAADAVDVGQQHELARAEAGGDAGRGVVRVDVADEALLVARERRDHRHLAGHEQRVEEVAADADHVGHEAQLGDPLADEQPAVDARQAHGVDAEVAQGRHQLAVDDAAQDGGGHLERGGIGHPQAALEAGRDAEALEPVGHAAAAAVHEDDRAAPGQHGHLGEHVLLLGERRAAELEDEDLAHGRRPVMSCTPRSRSRTPP